MRVVNKNRFLVTLILFLVACCMAAMLTSSVPAAQANSEGGLENPTTNITNVAEDEGFYMVNGASVHTLKSAIRFETVVSKGYFDSISVDGVEVEFIATAMAVGGNTQTLKFPVQPSFSATAADSDTVTLVTVLDFENFESTATPEQLEAIYKTEFIIESYAKITTIADDSVRYEKAYKEDYESRSMRAVALRSYLVDQEQEGLTKYFGNDVSAVSDEVFGGAYLDDNKVRVSGLPAGDYSAHVNATPYGTVTVGDDGVGIFETATGRFEEVKETNYVLLFNEAGKAFTGQVVTYDDLVEVNKTNYETTLKTTAYNGKWTHMVLTDDLTITSWNVKNAVDEKYYDFYGTFDGQGHNISLTFADVGTQGLFRGIAGEIKNVSVTDVNLRPGDGTFAAIQLGSVDIDNVAVKVKSVAEAGYQGGLIERNNDYNYVLTINNTYVEMPTTAKTSGAAGYVSGFRNDHVVIGENVTFVGGYDIKYNGAADTADYVDCQLVMKAIDEDKLFSNTQLETLFRQAMGGKWLFLNSTNFTDIADTTKMDGVKYVYLTENVTLTGNANGGRYNWNTTTVEFNGLFDGNGNYIKGLSVYGRGLFYKFAGTIKNVAILNVRLTEGNSAAIARETSGTTIVENVFIQISAMTSGNAWRGGLFERGTNARTIKNTIVCFDVEDNPTHTGYLSGYAAGAATLKNVYMVGSADRDFKATNSAATGSIATGSTYQKLTKTDFSSAYTGGTLNDKLSDQMKVWVDAYLGA